MVPSPWGPMRVADAHVHFFSHRFFSLLAAQKPGLTFEQTGSLTGWQMPPEDPAALAHAWAHELDRHGVERAALIASLPGDEESAIAAVAAHPKRFWGYFMVNPLAPDTVARVQGALDRGMHAVCFFPAMHRYHIHDDAALAVIDVIAATRPSALVFVHCGVLTVGVRSKLGLASPFDMRYSNPIGLHGVALRFPHLRFVVPHFGAGYFREALMLAEMCPNVFLDTSSSNRWMHYEGFDLRTVFRRSLELLGPRRLLFGSDSSFFPRGWHGAIFDAQARALYELGLEAKEAGLIFGENLLHLLA